MKNFLITIMMSVIIAGAIIVAALVIINVFTSTANAQPRQYTTLDLVNLERLCKGHKVLLPLPSLEAAALAGARAQDRRNSIGHHGTMPMGVSEGAGYGRMYPFKFYTCFHQPGWYGNFRYAGAAVSGGYATIVLDHDKSHGAIGSGGSGSRRVRRGLFFRHR